MTKINEFLEQEYEDKVKWVEDIEKVFIEQDTFMRINPPCKECIVRSTCVSGSKTKSGFDYVAVMMCGNLRNFLLESGWFKYDRLDTWHRGYVVKTGE